MSRIPQLKFIKSRVVCDILEEHFYWHIAAKLFRGAPDDVTHKARTFIQLHQRYGVGDLGFKPFLIYTMIDSE
jgi:hypothetical protein